MKKFQLKIAPVLVLMAASPAVLAPPLRAQQQQNLGVTVTVSPVPDGAFFSVDGQNYTHAMSAIWPVGSKHTLSVDSTMQGGGGAPKTQYSFNGWTYALGAVPGGNTVTVVADPQFTYYKANFTLAYALSLIFVSCPDANNCISPGTISLNGGASLTTSQDIYLDAKSTVKLIASPNPGWVFNGWIPGYNQSIQGVVDTVTMNGPTSVYPTFKQTRTINLTSAPPGLALLADRTKVPTPTTLDWGWDTTHSVGVISPQQDSAGNFWVFQSWSDGGASTHSYQVAEVQKPDSLTATFGPGIPSLITTTPAGLSVSIDGRSNWPSYAFVWGAGETHRLEAPAQQTDSAGRVYQFSNWSNGGAAAQDFVVPSSSVGTGVRLNATYTPLGHLTVNTSLASLTVQVDGKECVTPCDVVRPLGTSVRLSAPATFPVADGVRVDFQGWPGSGSLAPDYSVTLATGDPVNLMANYRTMNRLVASSAPPNGATWTMSPTSTDGFFDAATIVTLSVTPLPGYRFHGFSGDLTGTRPSGSLSMAAPRIVQAQLDPTPYISPTGVSNAAGTTPQTAVAPGSILSIFGASFTADTSTGPTSPLAQTLGGVTVRVGGNFLPVFFVSPTQINVQLPDTLGLGSQTLTVSSVGLPDVQATFTTARNAPGLFSQVVGNQSFAMAFHQDGTPVTVASPAAHGELLSIYGTGFGPANHPRPEGFAVPSDPPFLLLDSPTILVGDSSILSAINSFAAPGQIGIDVVQFQLDDTSPSGTNALLHVNINGQDSNTVLLPIQ